MLPVHTTHYRPLTFGAQERNETQGKGLAFLAQDFRQKASSMISRVNVLSTPPSYKEIAKKQV